MKKIQYFFLRTLSDAVKFGGGRNSRSVVFLCGGDFDYTVRGALNQIVVKYVTSRW